MSSILSRTQVEIAPIPDWIDTRVLLATATDTITVPDGVKSVLMTATAPVWFRVKAGSTVAAVPSTDLSDGKGSLYFSGTGLFRVAAGSVLTFAATADAGTTVSLGWYGKNAP